MCQQVLMQTIEREPPSLKSYPDDRQPGGDVFGRNFKEVRQCPVYQTLVDNEE